MDDDVDVLELAGAVEGTRAERAPSTSRTSTDPIIIRVESGDGNHISNNRAISNVTAKRVLLAAAATATKVLDSATVSEFQAETSNHTLRATP
ncbi:hypothetical protein [Streptomyces himalayensis]|uniref:Uncharacterized protein n=1 Tax=Streptomyces himalayensis subsp. himalayensis TaxID=2756131 RepID=A0A7W0DSF0_9ACTN|nr:hypothetical protein [Streptomyces himalayensis subsp. himalayensis]